MTTNCLVTKLKGSVSADLEKFGELVLLVPANTTATDLGAGSFPNQVLSWDGDVVITDFAQTTTYTSPLTIPENINPEMSFKISSGASGGTLHLTDKYKMRVGTEGYGWTRFSRKYNNTLQDLNYWFKGTNLVGGVNRSMNGDLSDISGMTQITKLSFNGNKVITCNLSSLSSLVELTDINFYGMNPSNILGNIASLGTLTKLNSLIIPVLSNINGSLESLVQVLRSNGKTTGSISTLSIGGTGITFNGESVGDVGQLALTWTSSTITFNNVTIDA